MTTLNDLSLVERDHWLLHLNAALKDTPALKAEIEVFTNGGELPSLKHPASIHDWLEHPGEREKIDG